jgi:hypothetical protein
MTLHGTPSRTDHWKHNIRLFTQKFNGAKAFSKNDSSRVKLSSTQSGSPTALIQDTDSAKLLHSSYEPLAEAQYWAQHVGQGDWQIGIILGFGLGYHIEELVRRYPERILIVLEPDKDVFTAALRARDLRHVLGHENVTVNVGDDVAVAAKYVFDCLRRNLLVGKPALLAWPPTKRMWRQFWEDVQKGALDYSNQDLVNMATYRSLSLLWLQNFFINFRTSFRDPGLTTLQGIFAGKPAFLVAAGPSLDTNAHLLAQVKGRAIIIAVLQAVRSLQKHGIEPDLIVSFDPKEINYTRHFADLDTKELALCYVPILYPRIVKEHSGPRFVVGADIYPFSQWLFDILREPKGVVASGPSVANVAWDIARQLGCDPLIFVGQDLAFTGERSHADNVTGGGQISPELLHKVKENPNHYCFVEGWDGERILTNKSMLAMKIWFEQKISEYSGRRFIDATEGGAKIIGTEPMTLQAAIDEFCSEEFHPGTKIRTLYEQEVERLQTIMVDDRLNETFDLLKRELREIQRIGQRAVKPLRTVVSLVESRQITERKFEKLYRHVRQLDRSLNQLETSKYCVAPVIHHQIEAVNIIANQFLKEQDLVQRGKLFADVYLPLFQASVEAASSLERIVDRVSEMTDQ